MKKIITIILLAGILIATTSAQPTPPTGPTEYTLKASAEEVNWIGRALDELPAKISNPIAQRLLKQVTDQNEAFKKAHEPPAPEAKPEPEKQTEPSK